MTHDEADLGAWVKTGETEPRGAQQEIAISRTYPDARLNLGRDEVSRIRAKTTMDDPRHSGDGDTVADTQRDLCPPASEWRRILGVDAADGVPILVDYPDFGHIARHSAAPEQCNFDSSRRREYPIGS